MTHNPHRYIYPLHRVRSAMWVADPIFATQYGATSEHDKSGGGNFIMVLIDFGYIEFYCLFSL